MSAPPFVKGTRRPEAHRAEPVPNGTARPQLRRSTDPLQAALLAEMRILNQRLQQIEERMATIESFARAGRPGRRVVPSVLPVLRKQRETVDSVLGSFRSAGARARKKIRSIFAYRLGTLVQFQPQPLRLPARYFRPIPLADVPKISIVTPSFRQGAYIERTVRSVLDQNYPDLEYVVQDGGSADETVDILKRYADRLASWESRPDQGQSHAINLGFARTSGEIMAWLNSDDVLLPGTLAYVANYFHRHPDVDVVYGHRIMIDEQDRQIGRWMMPPHDDRVLSWADYIPQETMFWRRRIWDKVGAQVDESFRFAMDWDLILRFRDAGARFVRLPRFLGAFRIHTAQKSSAEISSIGMQEMARLRERILGRVPQDAEVSLALRRYLRRHVVTDLVWRVRRSLRVPG